MAEIEIQGIWCKYRDLRESYVTEDGELIDGEEILYANLPQDEQIFVRVEDPFDNEDQLVEIAKLPYEERVSQYTNIQKLWVEREERRMSYGNGGVYAMINGVLTYIPASYWGYINYWTLEHGEKPDYREADRIFFLFMEYLYFETDVLAVTRGKGRRQGASSLGFYFMWWICGRLPEKNGGSISFNDDAAGRNFANMFMRGFKSMLPCFVRDFDSSAEKFVRFVKKVENAKKGVIRKREGLNSHCGFLPNSINSYDSGRVSFGLFDEGGKYHKINVNTYWSKVSPTLKQGRNKVGFAYFPTTVNPKNQGGENFQIFWNEANQNAINPNTGEPFGLNTPHRVVRYFVPATEGYAGCIDKFGRSIIDDPEKPIMGNDGKLIFKGAKTIILEERALKTGEQLMEHRRDFPLDEFDMFAFTTGTCEFNEEEIMHQIEYLKRNPEISFWRKVRMTEEVDENGRIVAGIADDPKGEVWIYKEPPIPNKYKNERGILIPDNTLYASAGADTYKNIFAINGSKGVVAITQKSNIIDGEERGLMPIAFFVGRPKLIKEFNRQAFLLCLYYGCKINYESDAGTWFFEDFQEWGALSFLEWTPARDISNPNFKIKPGTESANPFQLAKQLEVAKIYFDGTKKELQNGNTKRVTFIPLLEQALAYDHSERTPYDIMVAFQMSLLPMYGTPPKPAMPTRVRPIMPMYSVKIPA